MKPALAQSIDIGICSTADQVIDALRRQGYLNDRWCAQQKLDGQRVLIEFLDGKVVAYNRAGDLKYTGVPHRAMQYMSQTLTGHWVFDGEVIDDVYWIFDILHALTVVSPLVPCYQRLHVLEEFFKVWQPTTNLIQLVPRAPTEDEKIELIRRVFNSGGEGIILRDGSKPYPEGRRTTALLKAKFISDADLIVLKTKHEGKDNLVLGAFDDDGRLVEVGHCTALSGNGMDAVAGNVVTVQYLYVTADNRLYQPTRPRIRDDKRPEECTFDQFRYVNKAVLV